MIPNRLSLALFLMRITVFVTMLMWTIDKFLRPQHAAAVFKKFYHISGFDMIFYKVIGGIELVILAGFVFGIKKKWTYGAVLMFHAVSTLSSYKQYMAPFAGVNLLFFTALPMLAACFALYLMRDQDTFCTIG